MADPAVVGVHAHNAADQGLVGAVALVGLGKGAVEQDLCLYSRSAQQSPCDPADPGSACGVGAGGADHHRAQNIKYVQAVTSCIGSCRDFLQKKSKQVRLSVKNNLFPP